MNREDANKKAREIFREWSNWVEETMIEARSSGKWKPGLDANNELFKEINKEAKRKIEDLKQLIDD